MNNGSVSALWRYPVKSIAGEELESIRVSQRGLLGDRAYAFVDGNKVGSAKNAKRFGQLLTWRARFAVPPVDDHTQPPVVITTADGRTMRSDDPAVDFGLGATLAAYAPDGLMMEIGAGALGGKFVDTTEIPVSGGSPKGTFYNYAPIHIVTTSTLRKLDENVERFRPNIVVDCSGEGFVENDWVGKELMIGSEVRLRVTIPCPRCVVTTLPRTHLRLDPSVLQKIGEMNRLNLGDFGDLPCAGVYAEVLQEGRIQRGDLVRITS